MSSLRVPLFALVILAVPSWCAAQAPPEPVYFTRGFEFEEVEVSRVAAQLRSFGIPVPVALEGTATVDLSVSIPLNRLTDGRAYRVRGTLQSPALQVDRFRLGDLTAALTIENGRLSLTGVEGEFLEPVEIGSAPQPQPSESQPSESQPAGPAPSPSLPAGPSLGRFAGEATVELLPLGQFRADLRVEDLDVRFFDPFLAEPVPALAGAVDGVVELSAPVERIGDGAAYQATATLEAERVRYAELSLVRATANLRLQEGTVEVTSLAGNLQSAGSQVAGPQVAGPQVTGGPVGESLGVVRGTASLELIPLGQVAVQLELEPLDLALLNEFIPLSEATRGEAGDAPPAWQLAGTARVTLEGSAAVSNADELTAWAGSGEFALERLVVQSVAGAASVAGEEPRVEAESSAASGGEAAPWVVDSGEGKFELAAGTFSLDPVRLELDGVPLRGSATLGFADAPEQAQGEQARGWSATVRSEEAEVAELVEWLAGAVPEETMGTVSFALAASGPLAAEPQTPESPQAFGDWNATGTIAGSEVQIAGFRVGSLNHHLQLSPQQLSLQPVDEAQIDALLLQSLRAEYRSSATALTLENFSLQGWDGQLSGEATWSLVDGGQHRAAVSWSGFDFSFTSYQASTSGEIEWTAPEDRLEFPAAHEFRLRADVTNFRRGDQPLGTLEVSLDARQLPWQLRGSGELFEVPAEVSATLRVPAAAEWETLPQVPGQASVVAGPFALEPLLARLASGDPLASDDPVASEKALADGDAGDGASGLRGIGAARIDAVLTDDGPPRMTAELAVEGLGYGERSIAETFVAASDLQWLEGRLRLLDLRGELRGTTAATPPLAFWGLAVAELSPLGEFAFDVATDAVDLAWFNPWIPDGMGPFDGVAQGRLRAAVPLAESSRVAAWEGTAEVASPRWRMGELRIEQSSAELVLDDAVLVADRISGVANGVALAGRVALELETDRNPGGAWQARLQTVNAAAADLFALFGATPPPETSGYVSFEVDAAGQVARHGAEQVPAQGAEPEQAAWQARGELSADALQVAGIEIGRLRHHLRLSSEQVRLAPLPTADVDRLRLVRLAADYRESEEGYRLQDLQLEGWGGRLAGSAFWSRSPQQRHRAEVEWSGLRIPIPLQLVELGRGERDGGEEASGEWSRAELRMLTAGDLAWSAPADALERPSAHQFSLRAAARELELGGVELGSLELSVDARDPSWTVAGEGTLLSGPAEVTAAIDVSQTASWDAVLDAPAEGELEVGPVQLGELFRLWQPEQAAEGWSGVAGVQWTFESDGQSPLQSAGELRIENLSYRNQSLTDRLILEAASTGGELDIRSVRGTYAGGRIVGSGRWTTGAGPRQLVVRLSGIDAGRALLPVVATSGDWFAGRVSADLVLSGLQRRPAVDGGAIAEGLRVSGRMQLRNGEVLGLQAQSLRGRIQGAVNLPSLRWSLELSDLQVSRGRGQVAGHLRLNQSRARSDRVDLDSQFTATDLDFQDVLAELAGGGPPTFGSGSLTGTATLSGRAIESFADLEGRIVGRLGGTDATAVPGLISAQNYLGVLSIRNTEFDRGAIEARLRQGELQILELWLASDQLRLWADGSVSLRSGRLDIDAVAATGDFQASNPAILSLARLVALEATLPISVLTRANELLSNRVVNLSLAGTYRRPVVRVRPAETLTRNAVTFFLREAAGMVGVEAGVLSTEY